MERGRREDIREEEDEDEKVEEGGSRKRLGNRMRFIQDAKLKQHIRIKTFRIL